ncbi:MAG: hypothetical protein M1812_003921 [Candelaria pacifica]|nr:MAG: hypothetical protein M1812_003921 [Candelaria pacifica]
MGGVPLNAFSDAKKTLKGMFKRSRKGKQAEQPSSHEAVAPNTPAKPNTSTEASKPTTTASGAPQLPPTATGPSLDPISTIPDQSAPADPLPVKDAILKEGDTNKALPREPTSSEPAKAETTAPATTAAGTTTTTTRAAEDLSTTAENTSKTTGVPSPAITSAPEVTTKSPLPPNTHTEKPLPYTNASSATGMSATSGPLDDHPAHFAAESSGSHLEDEEGSSDLTPFATPLEAPLSGGFEKPTGTMDSTVEGDAGAPKTGLTTQTST